MKASNLTDQTRSFARRIRPRATWLTVLAITAVLSIGGVAATTHIEHDRLANRLLVALPDEVPANAELARFAAQEAAPLYRQHCAACHGADLKGDRATGAPNLTDSVVIHGRDNVYDIERSILYGIHAGVPKGRDLTEMPAFGLSGRMSSGEIHSVVQYVLQLSRQPHDAEAANQGSEIFYRINCGDCHNPDGTGNPDYGAPDLTANVWNSGGDAQALYDAIYFGQRHVMPAWRGVLSLGEIRALAVYVYLASHPRERSTPDRVSQ